MLSSAEVADLQVLLALAQADIAGWTHSTYLEMADRATHVTYTDVAQVLGIEGLELGGDLRDVTSHLSGGWMEKLDVLKDGGQMTLRVHFLSSAATLDMSTGLGAAALARTLESFHIHYKDGSGLAFTAYVRLLFNAPVNGLLVGRIVLDVSGAVTVV
jgi:hypothetical protein